MTNKNLNKAGELLDELNKKVLSEEGQLELAKQYIALGLAEQVNRLVDIMENRHQYGKSLI
jgi:hypothetical protein